VAGVRPGREGEDVDGTGAPESSAVGPAIGLGQIVRLITGLLWFVWAQQWNTYSGQYAYAAALSVASGIGGLIILAAALLVRGRDQESHLDRLIFTASLSQAVLMIIVSATTHGFLTDELAFDQAAATSLLHGLNPYTLNFTHALTEFGGGGLGTPTLGGQLVSSVTYPSLSFLFFVPGVAAFGATGYAGPVTDAIAWLAGGLLLWRAASTTMRPYLSLFVLLPVPLLLIAYGVTDPLYIPFMIIAVWRWDRFADPQAGRAARWRGPIALGLACAIKQTPWLMAPYLLVGVALEAHRRGRNWLPVAAGYALLSGATFAVVNLPFVVWNAGAWARTVLLPITGALVPLGLGPAQLVTIDHIGGGGLSLFGLAGDLALLATMALFIWRYDRLKGVFPLFPLIALFLSLRSLESYFVFVFPILIVAASTVMMPAHRPGGPRMRRGLAIAVAALSVASAGSVVLALAEPLPLAIGVQTASLQASRLQADVLVRNVGSRSMQVHFLLAIDGVSKEVMDIQSGPAVLRAGATAEYRIVSTAPDLLPSAGEPFQIQVVSAQPETLVASSQITVPSLGAGSP